MYYINMSFRKYVFLIGLIYFAISIAQPSYVLASQTVSDEIEKFISPTEEIQIDKPFQPDIDVLPAADIEEQPAANSEEQAEHERKIINTDNTEKRTISVKEPIVYAEKTTVNPKQEDLAAETPQINEEPEKVTVSEEESATEKEANPTPNHNFLKAAFAKTRSKIHKITAFCSDTLAEKKSKIHCLSIANFCNKFSSLFSELSFDTITEQLKLTILQHLYTNKFFGKLFPMQVAEYRLLTEHKQIINPKDFVPYYFLYPDMVKNLFEKIAFPENITNPNEFLPFLSTVKNYEVRIEVPKNLVTPQGTTDIRVLLNAPSPKIKVVDKSLFAKIVIDIRNNTLYKYDRDGFPLKAYLVATGARGSRTNSGLRIVTYKEQFPYRWAPINSKRLFDPYSYGPYILFLNVVNPKTGRQYAADQLLHGNGNEHSIGRKVSHGCVRMNNKVMKQEISKEVNRGDYILLINPDVY